jgi:hypothetical protein
MKYRGKLGEWFTGEYEKGCIDGHPIDISTLTPFSSHHDSAGREIYAGDVIGWPDKEERGIVKRDILGQRFVVEVNGEIYPLAKCLKKGAEVVGNLFDLEE